MTRRKPAASKTAPTVWVLTREHNAYDQHGEYFEAVFAARPSLEQLATHFEAGRLSCDHSAGLMGAVAFLEHLRAGGGRRTTEDTWYNLTEHPMRPGAPAGDAQ